MRRYAQTNKINNTNNNYNNNNNSRKRSRQDNKSVLEAFFQTCLEATNSTHFCTVEACKKKTFKSATSPRKSFWNSSKHDRCLVCRTLVSYPFMCIHHGSTLVTYTCIKSLMLEVVLSRNKIVVCPHCCLVRGQWKRSCHCGPHLSKNTVVNLPAPQTATKCSNQSEGSVGALNQLCFKLVKGRDKATVNIMSNYVSASPTSSALAAG